MHNSCTYYGECNRTACSTNCLYFVTWIPLMYDFSYPIYDTDRYELVEKKDWRINELKRKLREEEGVKEITLGIINSQKEQLLKSKEVIYNLEREIKELEK